MAFRSNRLGAHPHYVRKGAQQREELPIDRIGELAHTTPHRRAAVEPARRVGHHPGTCRVSAAVGLPVGLQEIVEREADRERSDGPLRTEEEDAKA